MEKHVEFRTGTLVRWLKERGFGFITPDIASPDLFVHKTDIIGEIPIGTPVQYEIATFAGRTKAIKVVRRG